jgi:hypothetical protein
MEMECLAIIPSTGFCCKNKAKKDWKCGLHNRPIKQVIKCNGTLKTGYPCNYKAKINGKCSIHDASIIADCYICQIDCIKVQKTECCKQHMCQDCSSQWSKYSNSCAFCRTKNH